MTNNPSVTRNPVPAKMNRMVVTPPRSILTEPPIVAITVSHVSRSNSVRYLICSVWCSLSAIFGLTAESSFLLQPRLAQGGKNALGFRRIFVGQHLPPSFQRELGTEPQDFCHFSPGFLLVAGLTVGSSQVKVSAKIIGGKSDGSLENSDRLLVPSCHAIRIA